MLCNFNKIFRPTQKDREKQQEFLAEIHAKAEERRKHITLVQGERNDILYRAEPLMGFLGDCENCKNYSKSPYDFVTGGECSLHHIYCGYGFVCKDVDGDYPFDYTIKEREEDIE